jgi:hypothetical protein
LRISGVTKNPPTHIHNPFANAVNARARTKLGKIEDTRTTSDSAAIRSMKSHIMYVKKPVALGRKFASQ